MRYILASASPRRKELMEQAGFRFEVIPSTVEEKITKTIPSEVVMELAAQKAQDVFEHHGTKDCVVIGADTVVVYRDEILGKPADKAEAYDMLSMLADRTHQVYTGVSLIISKKGQVHTKTFYESTDVTFCPICKEDLRAYVESGDPLDKAGAYGIQGTFAIHVKCIKGDYNNVVGLPVCRLYQELLSEYVSPLSE
ncbi:Maf family protein [Bariatricus sp. SGI.154]|uniref:Maf family protein n=1 Tax=Bariatricus sp. SGI.154 TaxID=3420549 RepID=UPI003D090D20